MHEHPVGQTWASERVNKTARVAAKYSPLKQNITEDDSLALIGDCLGTYNIARNDHYHER